MRRSRTIDPVRPARTGTQAGLAYSLWLPAAPEPSAGLLLLHGAGSRKENQYDYARAALAMGFAVLAFDARGHGASGGCLDGRAVTDAVTMAELLRAALAPPAAVAIRGSSLGGYLAIRAAPAARAAAVVAICPPSAGLLRRLLASELSFPTDRAAVEDLLEDGELEPVVAALEPPLLLMHARGDERVPVELSRELAASFRTPESRLIEVPGGHHQSIQHDEELQAVSLRFVGRALGLR